MVPDSLATGTPYHKVKRAFFYRMQLSSSHCERIAYIQFSVLKLKYIDGFHMTSFVYNRDSLPVEAKYFIY